MLDTKESFLANDNRQRLIYKLSNTLKEYGMQPEMLTDCLSAQLSTRPRKCKWMTLAKTDLFVLLPHCKPQYFNLHFVSGTKIWTVRIVQATLGLYVCRNILFGHAFGGCDTTSSLFSIGKKTPMQKLQDSALFRQQAEVFAEDSLSQKVIVEAGEMALLLSYGGKKSDSLNTLKIHKVPPHQLSCSTSALEPKSVPPTA